jgi:hypothetical protein
VKQHLKDHWYIAIALIAIFVAGNGFGYVFGSKQLVSQRAPESVATASWSETTLDRLGASLELTAEQLNAIRPDIEATATKVIAARERTLLDYHVLLLALHDEIGAKLDGEQLKRLETSKSSLENTIRSRFGESAGQNRSENSP